MSDRVRRASPSRSGTAARVLAGVLALIAAGCGGDGPTQPPPAGPFLQCPADIQVDSPDGAAVPVHYAPPTGSGGTAPYSIACQPATGTALGIGAHAVTCTLTDAAARTAVCSFNVRVEQPPRLSRSRFLAFGDSITEGQVSHPPTIGFRIVEPENSYPTKLDALLRARYRGQSLTVINAGRGGERAGSGSAKDRLESRLDRDRPEVVLLMEGTNDAVTESTLGGPEREWLADGLAGVEEMVERTRSRGVRVMLATIPPARPPGDKNLSPELPDLIAAFNAELRQIAARHSVPLVEVYGAMIDRPDLIGRDGLHPTVQGYEAIAQTFFDAIRAEYEGGSGQ
jgi:lysophospholipase L1-like esterase